MKLLKSLLAWLLIASTTYGAIGSTAVWYVGTATGTHGDDTNGAAFDAAIASAGTNYADQDSPQISHTDWSCTSAVDATRKTIVTSSTDCTAAMIGNSVRISAGSGWVTGYYFVTAVPSSSSLTLDASPAGGADRTSGTGKLGGRAATIQRVGATGNASQDKIVAGNIVYIRGSGTDAPSSADYTYTTFFQPVSGTAAAPVKFIGVNGRPRFDGSSYDCLFFNIAGVWVENIYLKGGTASLGYLWYMNSNCTARNCIFHTNDLNIDAVDMGGPSCRIHDCEFISHATAATTRTGKALIAIPTGEFNCSIEGNTLYRAGGSGIRMAGTFGGTIANNLIVKPKEYCINMLTGGTYVTDIFGNTLDGAAIDCIKVADNATLITTRIKSNLITNGTTYGIDVAAGTAAANALSVIEGYNGFFGNGTNANNLTLDSSDQILGANPYTQANPPTTDWSVDTNVKALGFPHAFRGAVTGVATTSYTDIGGVQRQESGSTPGSLSGGLIIGR